MPKTKGHLRVFLCYAHGDEISVYRLYQHLTDAGFDVWLDKESLLPGQDWHVEISKAIRQSEVVIVGLSEISINKEGYIQREIRLALDIADQKPDGTIFIIPARLEECKIPARLSRYQCVDLFQEDGYNKLIRALHSCESKIDLVSQNEYGQFLNTNTELDLSQISTTRKKNGTLVRTSNPKESTNILRRFIVLAVVLGFILIIGASRLAIDRSIQPTATNTEEVNISVLSVISVTETPNITPVITMKIPNVNLSVVREMSGSSGPVVNMTFSLDSQTLLVGSGDGSLRMWEVKGGNLINTINGSYWYSLGTRFAFSKDGSYFASGSWNDLSVKLIQISDSAIIKSFAVANNGTATSIAMSNDGKLLAVSYWVDNVVRLWAVENGKLLRTLVGLGSSMYFSNDNNLIGILYGNELKIWDINSGNLLYSIANNINGINSFAFSQDNKYLVLGLRDGSISFREISDGRQISTLGGNTGSVDIVAFSQDGTILATSNVNGPIKLWNTLDKNLLFTSSESVIGINTLVFSSDALMLASGAEDGTVRLWRLIR